MAATPKLTNAMMQGGGVYDSIIGQTATPRASEKVLMFLDRMAPSEPVDNVVVWTDDEEPADPRLHMFAPEHRRKGNRPQSVSTENEKLLDELAQSEMSYPHDEHGKKTPGGQKRSVEDRLEGYGSRGWTPQVQNVPMSPVDQYSMPNARAAGVHSRQGSRAPSRVGRPGSAAPPPRPGSARPAHARQGDFSAPNPGDEDFLRYGVPSNPLSNPHNNAMNATPPVALQIDIKAPSVGTGDMEHHGPRSLASTDEELYAAGETGTPRVRSPTGVQHMFGRRESPVAALRSPFRGNQGLQGTGTTPQGLAASVPLPQSRAPSAMGYSRPVSRLATGFVRGEDPHNLPLVKHEGHEDQKRGRKTKRTVDPPLTAAAFETPWFHRTQYGKHDPPVVVSTLRLKLVDPPPPVPPKSPPASDPPRNVTDRAPVTIKTPIASKPTVEIDPGDEHVHGHVHEVVGEEPDVVVSREELEVTSPNDDDYGHIDDDDIGHHVQEHYDVVDNQTYRSLTPRANAIVLAAASEPGLADLPETEIVDVDYENMNERQLVEALRTPAMKSEALDYSEDVQRALDLHHDEDLCVLLQAAEDELQHPVVRKAVRKAIAGRLKKLGLAEDYDAVKKDPRQAARLAHEAFGSPRSIITTRLPDDAPEWAKRLSESVRQLTQQMQSTGLGDHQPRRIKGPGRDGSAIESDHDSLHPGHAVDERGMRYHPDTEADTEGLLNIQPPAEGLISPGERLYDEEVYKLRKRNAPGSPRSHATWEIEEEIAHGGGTGSALAGEEGGDMHNSDFYRESPTKGRGHRRQESGSQTGGGPTTHGDGDGADWIARYSKEPTEGPPPWLKVNQRLLNWAVIWPYSELENSLKSCERGEQVDEVALTIWTAQIYKRYVRAQMTTYPPQTVDKMFVPPNIADAINNAAYNGRHDEVAVMLRELWAPFGFKGHPKIILALTKHRREENHWVVHRFSLPDASIITYDTYLEKSLPDGRPLGWWFGIRIAFSSDNYPPPDQVMQRMIRLHRPLQLQVDNSLGAAAIWRNLIMGSKADRLVDLERLRDLIRQEVKGIRGKKEQGKLSLGLAKGGGWSGETRAIEA